MNKRTGMISGARSRMTRFLYRGLAALLSLLVVSVLIGLAIVKAGLVPIEADVAPSALETRLFSTVVRASVSRHSSERLNAEAPTEDELSEGAEIYKSLCAQCHGQLNGRASTLGASFYPPAPQLPGHGTAYTEAQVSWIVEHGIRNTSMPSWRRLLSDDDIRKVSAFLKRMDSWSDKNAGR